jgi:hypothetical protein
MGELPRRSALKSDALSRKDLWLVFTSAEHNVGKSSCYSNDPAKASDSHFRPSEIFEKFLLFEEFFYYIARPLLLADFLRTRFVHRGPDPYFFIKLDGARMIGNRKVR